MMTVQTRRPGPLSRKAPALLAAALTAILAALLLTGCGVRYYSATVSGYVRESKADANGTYPGINGAEVQIFLVDPATDASAEASVRTSTMTSGNNDGYWSHKVMWETSSPSFADEGDSGAIWVKIMRKGYFPVTVKVDGILSDASNVVPTIEMEKIFTTKLRGRLLNDQGSPVNNVNVVLDLMSTADDKADYTATTATVDGVMGVFEFNDIAWNDPDSIPPMPRALWSKAITDGSATEQVKIYVDDPNYYSDSNSADERYMANQSPFTITSGEAVVDRSASPITIYAATFSATLIKGRVLDAAGNGLNKVTMALRFPVQGGNPQTVTTASLGGQSGWYQFDGTKTGWTNNRPTHSAVGMHDDVTKAQIWVNDGNYYSANDGDKPLEVSVTSDSALNLPAGSEIRAGDARFKAPLVRGRVVYDDGVFSTGVNGVQVTLELASDPQNPLGTQTATIGSDGYFEFKNVQWTDTKPELDSNGYDYEQARVYIQDTNYNSDIVQASPILIEVNSDPAATATVADMPVKKRNFNCPKISGSLVTSGAVGIGGVTVVLHRQSDAGTGNDLSATTDKNGAFSFSNVQWTDDSPTGASNDDEDYKLSLQSSDYKETTSLGVKTISSDTEAGGTATWQIVAQRTTVWSYSVTLSGTCSYQPVSTDPQKDPVAGVTVTIDSAPDALGGGLVTNASGPIQVNSDANGNYSATVTWTRDATYSPPADAAANGGDKLTVAISFSQPGYTFTAATKDLLSWSQNNIVDAVGTKP